MATYLVSYDLRAPGRDYSRLYTRLSGWGAVRALESVWLITAQTTAAYIRDDLQSYIDSDDRLLVAGLTGETAWTDLITGSDRHLHAQFGRAA